MNPNDKKKDANAEKQSFWTRADALIDSIAGREPSKKVGSAAVIGGAAYTVATGDTTGLLVAGGGLIARYPHRARQLLRVTERLVGLAIVGVESGLDAAGAGVDYMDAQVQKVTRPDPERKIPAGWKVEPE